MNNLNKQIKTKLDFLALLNDYRKREVIGRTKASFAARMAYTPVHFEKFGFPTQIQDLSDLGNLVDSMHDGRSQRWFLRLGKLNEEETKILINYFNVLGPLCQRFTLPAPRAALINSIFQYRQIKQYFPEVTRILEVGPGSGHLSVLCGLEKNRKIVSLETTETFFVWQEILYREFKLLGNASQTLAEFFGNESDDSTILHLPWWKFAEQRESLFSCELVVANHVLCEMSENALRHLIKLAVVCKVPPSFFVEGEGDQSIRSWSDVIQIFGEYGYDIQNLDTGIFLFKWKDKVKDANVPSGASKLIKSVLRQINVSSGIKQKSTSNTFASDSFAIFSKMANSCSISENPNEEFLNFIVPEELYRK